MHLAQVATQWPMQRRRSRQVGSHAQNVRLTGDPDTSGKQVHVFAFCFAEAPMVESQLAAKQAMVLFMHVRCTTCRSSS